MTNEQPLTYVTKAGGYTAPFSAEKVRASLERSGASPKAIDAVIKELTLRAYPGMPTHMVHKIAFNLLRRYSRPAAGRYHLKQAIFELGPTGFPFEQFIAALFQQAGFAAVTNQLMNGRCVKHEIDILAVKQSNYHIIECKYHQLAGTHCDVKTPLYVQARFKDIESGWTAASGKEAAACQAWLVTNTRFTPDALQYGQCAGLHLMSWDFPNGKSLKDVIDKTGLYPVTCLTTLNRNEKQRLLVKGVVLCETLAAHPSYCDAAGISPHKKAAAIAEAQHLCNKMVKTEWVM
jgi:hypothetical protein